MFSLGKDSFIGKFPNAKSFALTMREEIQCYRILSAKRTIINSKNGQKNYGE